MSSKIRILDEHTINQIAAGEVIENPSSVVKELVENAIDAKAREIVIEIKGGGRQMIRVSDNGCGMGYDDALLCLERHATSKIRGIDEIHQISTMGFRGEAVPSIASISKMTLISRRESDEKGTLISIDGGKILACTPAERSQGTTFEVKSLFFNVPVRKKFQRSPTYDAAEILKVVSIQALAHPEIKFELISNEERVLSAKLPEKELLIERIGERILAVLGKEYFIGLIPIEKEHNATKLVGFLGLPSYTRHNRTGQYLFINRRAVFSPLVSYAVREAFGTAISTNRHPVFTLFLTMDGSLVDVNVHPQKREVRLRQDFHIKEFIIKAAEEGLNFNLSPVEGAPLFEALPEPDMSFPAFKQSLPISFEFKPQASFQQTEAPSIGSFPKSEEVPYLPSFTFEAKEEHIFSSLRVIASMQRYLILSSKGATLFLLDCRAAHSRIIYDALMKEEKESPSVQHLLIPYTFELSRQEGDLLKRYLDYFNRLGLNLELFGENTFSINSIPQIFNIADIKGIILQVLHDLERHQSEGIFKGEIQKKISNAASKAAVSTQKRLSLIEGECLLKELLKSKTPGHCPHGKPTIVELKQEEIAKQFQK